jgi:hypothetical protein
MGAGTLLVIGYVWPEPRSSAAGGHMMQLLECFLAAGWQITFASPARSGEHRADLASLGIAEVEIELNCSSFDEFAGALQPDVVLFDRFMMEEQFGWRVAQACPNALRVLETSDLQSLREARRLLLKQQLADAPDTDDFSALFSLDQQALFERMAEAELTQRELAAIYRSDLNLMISDAEIELLQGRFGVPAALLVHCPLMLDAPLETPPDWQSRAHFLSIGNFRHAPNWDAVLWMKTRIWPLIRQQLPHAELHVYGAYTPPKATALNNPREGFRVLDWAPDALAVMRQARICLAPLRFGAGIKGKLAEAMLCGTPSVTTPIGAEAMHGSAPWPGAIASSASALAAEAVALYRDPHVWQQAQDRGLQLIRERYSAQSIGAQLLARIAECRRQLQTHRRNNFTGSMLRHHQHQSTRYMSQWIEAKNRLQDAKPGD